MGEGDAPVEHLAEHQNVRILSETTRALVDQSVRRILDEQRARARALLAEHRAELEALRDLLFTKKAIDRESLSPFLGAKDSPTTAKKPSKAKEG